MAAEPVDSHLRHRHPPPPQAPPREDAEEEEADDVSLSFYEFLEGLDAAQEGEVPPTDLQAVVIAFFETQRQERGHLQGSPMGTDGSSAPAA
jgi:hypothetical protein